MNPPSHDHHAPLLAFAFTAGLVLAGCGGGFVAVDGYDAAYVDAPVGIEAYPSYEFNDGVVYDVHGRYYHNHGGRWVAYRNPPPHGAARHR
ncbi:MAG TPA: hypothetical protein VHS09_01055 [Polyangiaceae bacterium]|nr:hypothetical protein [Polyangiaceae bacterium]